MTKYRVELKYPRTTRQDTYAIDVEAPSRSQAIAIAKLAAADDGWKGEAIGVSVDERDRKEWGDGE